MGPSFKDKTSETESYPERRYLFIEYIPPIHLPLREMDGGMKGASHGCHGKKEACLS